MPSDENAIATIVSALKTREYAIAENRQSAILSVRGDVGIFVAASLEVMEDFINAVVVLLDKNENELTRFPYVLKDAEDVAAMHKRVSVLINICKLRNSIAKLMSAVEQKKETLSKLADYVDSFADTRLLREVEIEQK